VLLELLAVAALAADLAGLPPARALINAGGRHADRRLAAALHQVSALLLWVADRPATHHVERHRRVVARRRLGPSPWVVPTIRRGRLGHIPIVDLWYRDTGLQAVAGTSRGPELRP
jgi:hypothetical protein